MGGMTKEQWAANAIKKYGSLEAAKLAQAERGRKGGLVQVPKGYSVNRELASLAGTKGGSVGKRRKNESDRKARKILDDITKRRARWYE